MPYLFLLNGLANGAHTVRDVEKTTACTFTKDTLCELQQSLPRVKDAREDCSYLDALLLDIERMVRRFAKHRRAASEIVYVCGNGPAALFVELGRRVDPSIVLTVVYDSTLFQVADYTTLGVELCAAKGASETTPFRCTPPKKRSDCTHLNFDFLGLPFVECVECDTVGTLSLKRRSSCSQLQGLVLQDAGYLYMHIEEIMRASSKRVNLRTTSGQAIGVLVGRLISCCGGATKIIRYQIVSGREYVLSGAQSEEAIQGVSKIPGDPLLRRLSDSFTCGTSSVAKRKRGRTEDVECGVQDSDTEDSRADAVASCVPESMSGPGQSEIEFELGGDTEDEDMEDGMSCEASICSGIADDHRGGGDSDGEETGSLCSDPDGE